MTQKKAAAPKARSEKAARGASPEVYYMQIIEEPRGGTRVHVPAAVISDIGAKGSSGRVQFKREGKGVWRIRLAKRGTQK